MFNYKSNSLPNIFDDIFYRNDLVHNYPTRRSKDYHLPLLRTILAQNTFVFTGPKFWNSLDGSIKNATSLVSFKFKLNKLLIEAYKTQ